MPSFNSCLAWSGLRRANAWLEPFFRPLLDSFFRENYPSVKTLGYSQGKRR